MSMRRKVSLRVLFAAVLAVVGSAAGVAIGASEPPTTDPCACRDGQRPGVHTSDAIGCGRSIPFPPPGGVSDGLMSACWGPAAQVVVHGALTAPCLSMHLTEGFTPSLDMRVGAVQGDYPPISHDPAWSTSPLAAQAFGEMPLSPAVRPMVGSALDMITGQPLVREVDFELPFGSTIFRHVRSYSQVPGHERESHSSTDGLGSTAVQEAGLWWDWAGHGWALSHNPVLLIDAAYDMWDRGLDDVTEGQQATHIERCMFLPDAHRTIPFISDGEGRYIAPARFEAQIAHDGEICTHAGGTCPSFDVHHWLVRPTTWTVWTENRGLKYTMAPIYEDMQQDSMGTSLNQYPPLTTNASKHQFYGRPYYAVATRIEDRHDNEIRLKYCDFVQSPCGGTADSNGCVDCCQGCTGKGRLSQVQLRAGRAELGSDRSIQYTLVYVYRENNGHSAEQSATAHRLQPMVHEVYVVPGHIEVPDRCRTIGRETFKAITDRYVVGQPQEGQTTDPLEVLEELHNVTWVDLQQPDDAAWLEGWTMRVRYLYADHSPFFQAHVFRELGQAVGPIEGSALRPIQISVTRRVETDPARDPVLDGPSPTVEQTEHRVYRHRYVHGTVQEREIASLRAIFSDASLTAMRVGGISAVDAVLAETTPERVRSTWPLGVHFLESEWPIEIGGGEQNEGSRRLLEWAETQFDYWGDILSGRLVNGSGGPSAGEIGNEPYADPFFQSAFHNELVNDYLKGVPKNPSGDGQERPEVPVMQLDGPAMYADRHGGQQRHYRVYRFLMTPTNVDHDMRPQCLDGTLEGFSCTGVLHACYGTHNQVYRAILHEPYMWATSMHANYLRKLKDTDRGNPLWISVVDELASYEDVLNQAVHPNEGVNEWDSIEGRMAASGEAAPVPLTRTVTLINSAGYVLSSRIYDFSSGTTDSSGMWEEFVYDWQSDEFAPRKSSTETRPLAIGRLLEHRGLGWSVAKQGDGTADLDDEDVEAGLVSVYGYDLESSSEKVREALLPSAVGLRWGTAAESQTLWLKQTVRDPERPELIVHEIEFTSPRETLLPYEVLEPTELVAEVQDSQMRVTTHARHFDRTVRSSWIEEDELSIEDSPLVAELTLRPPAKSSPDGVLEWPISITYRNAMWSGDEIQGYSRSGQTEVWTGAGAVASDGVSAGFVYEVAGSGSAAVTFDPAALDADLLEFYASVERIDPQGKQILKVVDVDLAQIEDTDAAGQPASGLGTRMSAVITAAQVGSVTGDLMASLNDAFRAPVMQSAWVRKASRPDINKPLEHWAFSSHDSTEPYFTIDHTGRQTRVFKRSTLDTETGITTNTRMVSKGLYRVPTGSWHALRAFELGEVTHETEGEDTLMHGVSWEYDGEESNPGHDPRVADIVTIVQMVMDAMSRPTELRVSDPKGTGSVQHAIRYGRFGEVTRERHQNGNIVRNVHDERGRLVAVYKGSKDAHEFWGTSQEGDPPVNDDDLLLTERRSYGTDVRDANLPIEVRTYRTKPANQYGEDPSGPGVDAQGASTRSIYDWRGRALVTRSFAPDTSATPTGYGPVVRQEVVFRDNQDQVLITAVFGSTLPWLDGEIPTLNPGDDIPSITDLLAAGPISLEQRLYDPRGQLRATRTYDVSDNSGISYLESETYQDFAGRTVYTKSHGNIITRNVQDAKGRQILSSTFVGEMELTRTETAYDDKDQPFRVKTYDRGQAWIDPAVSGYSAILSQTNAIITYRYSWYDAAGRVRATADIGTGRADGYITSTTFDDTVTGDPDGFAWDPNDEVAWIPYPAFESVEIRESPLSPRAPGTSSGSWLDGIDARYTSYAYDDAGNTTITVAPDGVVTRTRTNGLGQLVFQWENAPRTLDPEGGLVPVAGSRLTVNQHLGTNLIAVGVLLDTESVDVSWFNPTSEIDLDALPWDEPGKMLVSRVDYAAPVLNAEPSRADGIDILTTTPHSTNGEFIKGILYPTSVGEILSIQPMLDVTYTYYADGLLATRTDERGVLFKYYYDHAGRLVEVLADESNSTTYLYNDPAPKDRVDRLLFTYNQTTGQLESAQAFDRDGGPGATEVLIATNEYNYDPRLNLIAESQLHAGAVVPGTIPTTTYEWQYSSADAAGGTGAGRNFDRIKRLGYPVPVPDPSSTTGGTTNRHLEYFYGSPGSPFDAQSLVSRVQSTFGQYLARFRYTGSGRRVAFNRGGVTEQTPLLYSRFFDNPIADFGGVEGSSGVGTIYDANDLSGLTQFGQPRAVSFWLKPDGQPRILQAGHRYAYDPAGRRTAAWSWQRPVAGPNPLPGDPLYGTNQRSQLFGYDPLGRLIDARMGELSGEIAGGTSPAMSVSASDLLTQPRVVEWELDLRETWLSRTLSEDADFDGTPEISENAHYVGDRNELIGWEVPPATGPPTDPSDRFHNDASGNLILDDARFYEYDAWGRLARVSDRGTIAVDLLSPGTPTYTLSGTPGPWLAHYTYDALGRLIRKQTPVRNASTGAQTGIRTERYYYDGARRIQEVVAAPIELIEPFTGSGGDPLDGGTNIGDEMLAQGGEPTQPGGGSPGGGSGTPIEIQDVWLDREYVYVPSNAGGYVDEFIAQIDRFNDVWFVLQDANFNVLGLTDAGGELVEQRTYDPYGELLTRESFTAHPGFKAGHQGLFFDRLEPPPAVGGSVSMGAASQLEPSTFGIYQVRNRVLIPRYGRWAQKDPNASGMAVLTSGSLGGPEPSMVALDAMLADSWNLYSFTGDDPINRTDAMGLSWRESIEGVVLPIMSIGDFTGLTGMLTELLDGYNLMIRTHSFVQGAAFDMEDQVDWALDWDSNDWENSKFGNIYNPSATKSPSEQHNPYAVLGRRGPDWDSITKSGKTGEQKWANENPGSSPMKRYIDGEDADGNSFKRKPDFEDIGADGLPTGLYFEIKHGYQGATLRTMRQAQRDARLLRSSTSGVKRVKWVFYYSEASKRSGPSKVLLQQLSDLGIEVELKPY